MAVPWTEMEPDELLALVFPEDERWRSSRDEEEHAPPRPVDKFRQSAAGAVVAAGLVGLRDALEGQPEKDEPAIVQEAPTTPAPPNFSLEFADDPDDPTVTVHLK